MRKRIKIGAALLVFAGIIAGTTAYHNSQNRRQPVIFSKNEVLTAIWQKYKASYLDPTSGRTIDRQRGDITTSEGESYTMLRAVFQDDKATFDRSWNFTRKNLQLRDSHLFGYLYGKNPDGSYGLLLDQGGDHTASDADSDIALALILGYQRWQQSDYLQQAKPVITDIWAKEVISVAGRPVLTADNLEKAANRPVVVNPSYFSPYAYRLFAVVDKAHPWKQLIDSSYKILSDNTTSNLGTAGSAGLPPDWIMIDRGTGAITPSTASNLTINYGYDALRVPWRIGLDYEWNKEPKAKAYLATLSFLGHEWQNNQKLAATYSHDGKAVANYESPAMYGAAMGYFQVSDPKNSDAVYRQKLEALYNVNTQSWKVPLGYYEDNWAWFGMALKLHQLPNIGSTL